MSKADILRIPDYLEHIVEAIERIQRYVAGMSRSAFLEDDKTRDAVVRNYEIIGEAAHNIERYHAVFAERHPEVPWELMYTLRNRVDHGYFLVDYVIVWESIHADLPALHATVCTLMESLQTP